MTSLSTTEAKDGVLAFGNSANSQVGDPIIMTLTQPDGSQTTVESAVPASWDGSTHSRYFPAYIIGQYSVTAVVELETGYTVV